jgi:hypothetical protein
MCGVGERSADADAGREPCASRHRRVDDRDVDHSERHAGHDAEPDAEQTRLENSYQLI